MAAKLEKTSTPGVFKRGSRYVVIYRDAGGRQRQESARTSTRRASCAPAARRPWTRLIPAADAGAVRRLRPRWINRYQGNGRRGSPRTPGPNTAATSSATRSHCSAVTG